MDDLPGTSPSDSGPGGRESGDTPRSSGGEGGSEPTGVRPGLLGAHTDLQVGRGGGAGGG